MAVTSVDALVSAAEEYAQKSRQSAEKKVEILGGAAVASQESAQLLSKVSEDVRLIKSTEAAATLRTQSQIQGQAAATQIEGTDPANYLIQLATRQKSQNEALAGTLDTITKKTKVDFLDSPLQWIGAQITLPKDEEIARAQIAQTSQTHQAIQQTTQTFSAAAQTYKLQEQSVTAASAKAASDVAAAEALIKANQFKIETAKYNTEAVNAIAQADDATLRSAQITQAAQVTAEGQRMQELAFNAEEQNRAVQREMQEDARAEKKEGRALDAKTLEYLNLSLAQSGMPVITPEEAPIFLDRFKKGDPEAMMHWRNGRVISTQAVSKTRMGDSPAASAEFLSKVPTNLDGLRKDTAALIMQATSTIPARASTPQQKAEYINKSVNETVAAEYGDIRKGSMFDAGEVSQYFGISSIASLPLVSKVLAPLNAQKVPLEDPAAVMQVSLKAMKDGLITSSEFSQGIEQLYRKASMTNIAFRDLQGFGIKLPDGGGSYKTKLDRWGKPVDLLKPAEVNRWVTEQMFQQDLKETYKAGYRR